MGIKRIGEHVFDENQVKIISASPQEAGAGVSDAASLKISISEVNDIIETKILIDIQGLRTGGSILDIIGNDGATDSCHLGKLTTSLNGYVTNGEMICIETPAGPGNATRIGLRAHTTLTDLDQDSDAHNAAGSIKLFDPGLGTPWSTSDANDFQRMAGGFAPGNSGLHDHYLFLVNEYHTSSGVTEADYTAGKFIIRLFGTKLF